MLANEQSTFAASDINETKAKQQNHVIQNNQYKQEETISDKRQREREIERETFNYVVVSTRL